MTGFICGVGPVVHPPVVDLPRLPNLPETNTLSLDSPSVPSEEYVYFPS
jgi:hypothetical protein